MSAYLLIRKLASLLWLWIAISGIGFAQESGERVLISIHDRDISLEEFERIYRKNNSGTVIEKQSVEEYLKLFIDFKLKVIEAEERGMDTTRSFINEFNSYRKQLAKPYLTDKQEINELVREAYQRSRFDVHASHILIRLNEHAPPEDTLRAYKKALEIRQEILEGKDFGTVARATSDDPSAKSNGGDLGYFTVFNMIYPFETVACKTDPGEISMPFRTRFGYHILKVHDKRPARGQVRVAHLMLVTPENMPEKEKDRAKRMIHAYHDSIVRGKSFEEMVRKYSEDRGSASRDGVLAWFGTGRMVEGFEKAAFSLERPGDISEPVQTSFGWHIIKLLDKKEIGSFDEMKDELKARVMRSDRAKYARQAKIEKLKEKYGYDEFPGNLLSFENIIDSSVYRGKWEVPGNLKLSDPLFRIGDRTYTQMDLAVFLENEQPPGKIIPIKTFIDNKYKEFTNSGIMAYEEAHLGEQHPEYKFLLQEYHDGILLFDLTNEEVWSKALEDSTGLKNYYERHKEDYLWEKRLDAVIFRTNSKDIAEKAHRKLRRKMKRGIQPVQLVNDVCGKGENDDCMVFEEGIYEAGEKKIIDDLVWARGISDIIRTGNDFLFVMKRQVIKPTPKSLEEAKGLVVADYQNFLEKKWVEGLREKYSIHVNRELLKKIE